MHTYLSSIINLSKTQKKKKYATRIKADEQKRCVISAAINILGVPPDKRQPPAGATAAAAAAASVVGVFASIICGGHHFCHQKKNTILWGA